MTAEVSPGPLTATPFLVLEEGPGTAAAAAWRPPRGHELLHRWVLRAIRCLLRVVSRTQIVGLANIPSTGPVIIAGNHVSLADPFVLVDTLARAGRRTRMLGAAGLFTAPVVGTLLRHGGFIPVYRNSNHPAAALGPALASLGHGECVGLYPEGGITRLDGLWPARAKTGVVRLALASGAPVIPVTQWGTQQILGGGAPHRWVLLRLLRRPKIQVLVGRPIDMRAYLGLPDGNGATTEQLRAGADLIADVMVAGAELLRGQDSPQHAGRLANPNPNPRSVPRPGRPTR